MSEIQVNSLAKGIIADGLPNPSAIYINPITKKPWVSIDEFLTTMEDSLVDIVPYMLIRVGQPGNSKEYHNPNGGSVFVEKNEGSSSGSGSDQSTYLIKVSEWYLTPGLMTQNAQKHYTDAQYDAMYNNDVQLSKAIRYAYDNGYKKAVLETNTYCLCLYAPASIDYNFWPCIFMNDMNNFTLDLGGSTLKLCGDDTAFNPHFLSRNGDPCYCGGFIISMSYCRDTTVCNGYLVGDRFDRSYTKFEYQEGGIRASEAEHTYGIMPGVGCRNVTIKDIEFREFMGDGVCSNCTQFYDANDPTEIDKSFLMYHFAGIGTATKHNFIEQDLTENSYIPNCALSEFFDTTDANGFYAEHLDKFKNRVEDKKNRLFQINFPLGYTKTPSCYPLEMYVLTYSSNDVNAQPLRRIRVSYLSVFSLTDVEKYIKILFTQENTLYNEHSTTRRYTLRDRVVRFLDNVIAEFESLEDYNTTSPTAEWNNWHIKRIVGVGGTPTYVSGKEYSQGARVTANIGRKGVCYECNAYDGTSGSFNPEYWDIVETDHPCVSSIQHNIAIFEYIGSDLLIQNCRFINSHRGNVANLPHDSIIDNCLFKKHFKVAGDGFPAPNPGSDMDCTVIPWSTNYQIDQEDWFSHNIKIGNCRFEADNIQNNQMLLGAQTSEVSGCTGFLNIHLMPGTYINIHDNVFDHLDLTYGTEFLTALREDTNRYLTRDIFFTNNRILSGQWTVGKELGQRLIVDGNYIYEDFLQSTIDGEMFKDTEGYVFTNNTIKCIKEKKDDNGTCISISASNVNGSNVDAGKSRVNIFSPVSGNMNTKASVVNFCESLDNRVYKDQSIVVSESVKIVTKTDPNGNTRKSISFFDCDFESTNKDGCLMVLSPITEQRGQSKMTFDIYFNRCKFTTPATFTSIIGGGFGTDDYNLYFDGCVFDCATEILCDDTETTYKYHVLKFSNCTNGVLKHNDTEIAQTSEGGSGSSGDVDLSKTEHINLVSDAFDRIDDTYPFTFEKGKTYEIHADFSNQPEANEYVGPTMYLSQSGSSKTQSIKTDMGGLVIDATIIADDNYDGFKFNYASSCNVDMTIKFQGTLQEIINNSILESAPKDGITYGLKNGAWSSTSGELIKYPLAEWHPYVDPAFQSVETLTGFTFESGHKYYIDAYAPGESEWVKASIRLTMKNDSSRFQELITDHLYGYKGEFTPSQNWDSIYVYNAVGGGADIVIYDIGDTSTMINNHLITDVKDLKKNGEEIDGLRNLNRRFAKPYKISFFGDSITSNQVSDIGERINYFLGTEMIDNYACGSATLTNSEGFQYSIEVPFNTWTPTNTIANQVLRQIQKTTSQGAQIKWNVPNPDGTSSSVSIPTSVCTGLGQDTATPDICYMAIGINDDMQYLGDFDKIEETMTCPFSQLDCSTFASALRWAVETLRAHYHKVQIFIATPLFTGINVEKDDQPSVMLKRKYIMECCAWLSVYCIDSTKMSNYTHQTLTYFPTSDIHPRRYAKAFIGKMVAKEIYNNFIPEITDDEIVQ